MALSGVCLFIGLTEALPQKISVLGLDLSAKPNVAGWFVLAITAYFLLVSLVFGVLDLIKYYLPSYIASKSSGLTGDVIGLSEDECFPKEDPHYLDLPEVGTSSSEFRDIQRKKSEISESYNSKYIAISNFSKIAFDMVLPLAAC